MNSVFIHDRFHPFSPAYAGKEVVPTIKCDVCECEVEEHLTATVKEALWTVCVGCVKNLDLKEEFADATPEDFESIMEQLKPIL